MSDIPGARKPEVRELVRVKDRTSFLYLERCVIHRAANAITATDDLGTIHVPAATIAVLMLGPGIDISHHAVMLLGECGVTVVWVGEEGVRYYAHGSGLSTGSDLIQRQAQLVSSRSSRIRVAKAMYSMRFHGEDLTGLTMQQLRGREGTRVRRIYAEYAERYGVPWKGRRYDPNDLLATDPVNIALTAATSCLYGLAHAVIVSLNCSPSLGFVHTGNSRSFVFDIADLYKMSTAVPVAFSAADADFDDLPGRTRRLMRDCFYEQKLMARMVTDVKKLLDAPVEPSTVEEDDVDDEVNALWDGDGEVSGGRNWVEF